MEYNRGLNKSLLAVLEMSAGWFLAYGLFGLVAGHFGAKIAITHRPYLTAVAYFLLSALLISSAIVTFRYEKMCAFSRW
jgi:hypothetical protein